MDSQLYDQETAFRCHKSCVDQITGLRIIIKQSLEWKSKSHFGRFVLSHYEVPERLVSLVRNTYQGRHTGLPMLAKRPIAWRLHRGSTRMFTVAIPLPFGY